MKSSDLIKTAKVLLASGRGKPSAASLRRATSSAYYALFHHLARDCADLLIGGTGAERSKHAWGQVYRSLEHGPVRDRCKNRSMMKKFPNSIENFANIFVTMQEKRHDADYDPFKAFVKSAVLSDIALVESVLATFSSAPVRDRRAFCAYVLFKDRNR